MMATCRASNCGAEDGACTWLIDKIDEQADRVQGQLDRRFTAVDQRLDKMIEQEDQRNGRLRAVEEKVAVHGRTFKIAGAIGVGGLGALLTWILR